MVFSLFEVVTLLNDIPEEGLLAGTIGVMIDVYAAPLTAYKVEFCDSAGRTTKQLSLLPEQLQFAPSMLANQNALT